MTTAQPTLLVVDDEPSILKALQRTLRRSGYQVLSAESGAEGLSMLKEHPEIAVVIADFRMPKMNGVEMLLEMKSRSPSVVGLMLSGQADHAQVVDAMIEGVVMEFLAKPWNEQDLLATVDCAVNKRTSEA